MTYTLDTKHKSVQVLNMALQAIVPDLYTEFKLITYNLSNEKSTATFTNYHDFVKAVNNHLLKK